MPRRRLILTAALCILLGAMGSVAYFPLSVWLFSRRDDTRKADAAVVLGAAVYGNKPSPIFRERLRHAVFLYRSGTVKKIVLTGGIGGPGDKPEAVVARSWVISQGVNPDHTLVESKSRKTYENLLFSLPLLKENNVGSVLLVSDPLHMRRAVSMARSLQIQAHSSPTTTTLFRTRGTKIPFLVRESKDYAVFQARRIFGLLPKSR